MSAQWEGNKYSSSIYFEQRLLINLSFRHVQCVLNFENNEEEDGGTLIVPYFHRYLKTWNKVHEKQLRKPLPWVTLTKDVERQYLTYAHRIPMREVILKFEPALVEIFNVGFCINMGSKSFAWHCAE